MEIVAAVVAVLINLLAVALYHDNPHSTSALDQKRT
jgi:hypothetical protein